MLFSSLEFIFIFFPISLVIYYALPHRAKNPLLLAISLIFYIWGGLADLPIMLSVIVINYIGGMTISYFIGRAMRGAARATLTASVAADLAILFFFKYSGFALGLLRAVPSLGFLPKLSPSLPIGISFYTFQAISYLVDVYRRDCRAQKNIASFALYIALYPQLIAGPIVRYTDISEALARKRDSSAIGEGVERFIFGLSKKMILANPAGEIWKQISESGERGSVAAWLGIIYFSFQIYFDFSGYSDMAIGLGKIYGFEFPENFNYPYICRSITDFWRRWHITLSSFFKCYLYIPLGGNRRGNARTILNLFIVWSLTGLWHGAALNFIFWGIYYFALLTFEKSSVGQRLKNFLPDNIYRILTIGCVLGGWLIFACDRPGLLSQYTASMFCGNLFIGEEFYDTVRSIPFLAIAAIFSTPLPFNVFKKTKARHPCVAALVSFSLFILSVAYLVNSSFNPFLYFRF